MKLKPIVTSLLQTDLYKFNMMRVYFYRFTNVVAEFVYKMRTDGIVFTEEMTEEVNQQLDHLCTMRLSEDEVKYIGDISYHSDAIGFLEFLRMFRLNRDLISVKHISNNVPEIRAKGPVWSVSPFEIYVLEIVSEVYYRFHYADKWDELMTDFKKRLDAKIEYLLEEPFVLTEFGCRRRICEKTQEIALVAMMERMPRYLFGTSNVAFAKKLGLKPRGTFAHEYVSMMQAIVRMENSQTFAWSQWQREYARDNALGIALTDTLGQAKFEKDFNGLYANMFTGLRHDSGDPIEWGNKAIQLYEKFGIDPRSKTLFFSDGLNFVKARELNHYFKDKVKVGFGIGTFITADTCVPALNHVMKMVKANGHDVAKLSNVPGKIMCENSKYVETLKWAIS
jgi:nicotinate phosphoribosyltransferase